MNTSDYDSDFPKGTSGFDSQDCVIIYNDEPGDTTIRPSRPSLLPFLLAEREKLARWGGKLHPDQPPSAEKPTDRPEDNNSSQ